MIAPASPIAERAAQQELLDVGNPAPGLRVLEFTHTVMGPTAGLIFAELGADVIKVEPAPKAITRAGSAGSGPGSSPPSTATSAASRSI